MRHPHQHFHDQTIKVWRNCTTSLLENRKPELRDDMSKFTHNDALIWLAILSTKYFIAEMER